MRRFLAAAVLALAGCATPAIEVPDEVLVQVPTACVDPATRSQRPVLRSLSDLLGMDRYRRTIAVWSDLLKLHGYAAELEALVEGCARIPASR